MLDRGLTVSLPSDREIALSREFAAPRRLVFAAMTQPALLFRWFHGAPGWRLTECTVDARIGGAYRYLWREDATGATLGMSGTFLEVVPPERLVATEAYDQAWYEGEAVTTTTFVERGGRTLLTLTIRYASKATRDAVLQTPMAEGVGTGFDRLAALLAEETGARG